LTGMGKEKEVLLHEIEGLYRQKHLLLTGYLEMAQTQASMLEAGEWEKVAAVLAAKDKRIAEINRLDACRENCLAELRAFPGQAAAENTFAADEPDVAAAREAIRSRLEEIRAVEATNAAAVKRRAEELAREIGGMRQRKAAAASYGHPHPGSGSAFIDKKK
jgi:hypothetical protein